MGIPASHPSMELTGRQGIAFVVDPRGQGYGLAGHEFLDGYANKFYPLTGENDVFVSPRPIPVELIRYYHDVGIETAPVERTYTIPVAGNDMSLTDRLYAGDAAAAALSECKGYMVPYMVTPDVASAAAAFGLRTLISAATNDTLADKERFQAELAAIARPIETETGLHVAVTSLPFQAGDSRAARTMYNYLSESGRRDVVVVKPQSASALGIFVLRAERGFGGLTTILKDNFTEGERVLLEEFVPHNHSPSMQGVRQPGGTYHPLYFGRQLIRVQDERVDYDASQIPFGPANVAVDRGEMQRLEAMHAALGKMLIEAYGIAGVAGFDAMVRISDRGVIETCKLTELNLHLPSSYAVYSVLRKLFPQGFDGIAHNCNIPLGTVRTPAAFLERYADLLIDGKRRYGLLPLNLSYPDKADVVMVARDTEHLTKLLGALT